jgi:hypothetical protein
MTFDLHSENFYSQLRAIEKVVVLHSGFVNAVTRLKDVIGLFANGAQPRHALLLGESGTGKTWVARYLQTCFPQAEEDHHLILPIVRVETPSAPSIKSLAESLLAALGDPLPDRGSTIAKRNRALRLIGANKVMMIIFDEFQHFIDSGQGNSLQSVADWLKLFIDDCGIPCVLMGLPRCAHILAINEQLRRRFSTHLKLPPFSIATPTEFDEFRSVLNEFDLALPISRRAVFADPELAKRLYFASNGLMGYVQKLIIGSFELMTSEGLTAIDQELLRRVFLRDVWNDAPGMLNPFHQKFIFRPLDKAGEPFAVTLPTMRRSARKVTQ